MIFKVINLTGNCCETLTIIYLLLSKYKLKYNQIASSILFVFSTLCMFAFTNIFLTKSYLIIPSSIIYILFIQLVFDNSWFSKIINTVITYVVFALSELVVAMMLTSFLELDLQVLQNTASLFFICTISSRFLSFIIIYIILKSGFKYNTIRLNKYTFSSLLLPIASFLVLVVLLRCLYEIDDRVFHTITLIFSIILVVANIISVFIIDNLNDLVLSKEKLIFTEKQISNQISHYSKLYGYQNELRAFRHDIKNKCISIIGLLREGKTEEVINTLNKDINWLTESKDVIVNSGNPVIDAVLQSKMQAANDKDISVNYVLRISEDITIDEIELGIIIGNAMDNAIEESERIVDPSNRKIDLRLLTTNGRISINVKNSISSIKKDLTTSKPDKMNHGFGLSNIKSISQKYDGVVNTEFSADTFELSINIVNSIR